MKSYNELTPREKDHAIDKALSVVVKKLVNFDFEYKFKSPYSQKIFSQSFNCLTETAQIWSVMNSDEIAEELYPEAEKLAKIAFYTETNDIVFAGIVDQKVNF